MPICSPDEITRLMNNFLDEVLVFPTLVYATTLLVQSLVGRHFLKLPYNLDLGA